MSKLHKLKLNSMQYYYEQTKAFMSIQLIHIYIYICINNHCIFEIMSTK